MTRIKDLLRAPLLWGALYLAMIPAFGVLYSAMDGQFYQSTALQETGLLNSDSSSVLSDLKAASVAHKLGGADVPLSDGWHMTLEDCSWRTIGPHDEGVQVSLACDARSDEATATFGIDAVIYGRGTETSDPYWVHQIYFLPLTDTQRVVAESIPLPQPQASTMFFTLGGYVVSDLNLTTHGTIVFNREEERHFSRFLAALRGDPTAFSHAVIRMTYFSAITITTLGYGDIAPLSDTARALVGAEATLGVVLVGLFLNSLFNRSREPETGTRRAPRWHLQRMRRPG